MTVFRVGADVDEHCTASLLNYVEQMRMTKLSFALVCSPDTGAVCSHIPLSSPTPSPLTMMLYEHHNGAAPIAGINYMTGKAKCFQG